MAKSKSTKVKKEKKINLIKPVLEKPLYELPKNRKQLDKFDTMHPWVQEVLKYFAEDTTEKILANMEEMKVSPYKEGDKQYSGKLKRAIHWTIVNNARGNTSMVEFYYLKYGDYLGLSASGWLTRKMKNGKQMYESIKPGTVPLMQDLKGVPVSNMYYTGSVKLRPWKSKPFINSEIRRKACKLARRLARQFAFQGGMQIFNTFVNVDGANPNNSYGDLTIGGDANDFWDFVCNTIKD